MELDGMASQAVALIDEWNRDLDVIWNEVVSLWHKRHLFHEVMELYTRNVRARAETPVFENWLVDNYTVTIAVGIRRQADLHRKVVSMATLLRSLAANAALLKRDWFVEGYVAHGMGLVDRAIWEEQAHNEFDQFAPNGAACVSPEIIRRDQETLKAVSERVRRFVNERLAHRARDARDGAVPIAEVHAALDELGRLLQLYSLLLRRIGLETPQPMIQGDWKAVFRIPWLCGSAPSRNRLHIPGGVTTGEAPPASVPRSRDS